MSPNLQCGRVRQHDSNCASSRSTPRWPRKTSPTESRNRSDSEPGQGIESGPPSLDCRQVLGRRRPRRPGRLTPPTGR